MDVGFDSVAKIGVFLVFGVGLMGVGLSDFFIVDLWAVFSGVVCLASFGILVFDWVGLFASWYAISVTVDSMVDSVYA